MKHFGQSENMKAEYCCQVVRIGELIPIEGSDFLAKTIVSGNTIVVRKDEFKEGDYALYAKNETMLNKEFLSVNNLFELSAFEMNKNADEVRKLLDEDKRDKAKKLTGFFSKHGRVKALKLRGVYSMGFLFHIETLALWKPEVRYENLTSYIINEEMGIGQDFDLVCGENFVKAYVPNMPVKSQHQSISNKRQKKIEKFERIADSNWKFHYDTIKLNDNIWMIEPDDVVDVSVKLHGTSFISGNIKIKYPAKLTLFQRLINFIAKKVSELNEWINSKTAQTWYEDFGNIYSSRGVIKNKFINKKVTDGYYGSDVWYDINEIIKPYIDKGMMVYGEICGYITGENKPIQKSYDYGCNVGENFLMPYRITTINEEDNTTKEWSVTEVVSWTNHLIEEHPELKGRIMPMTILYHGKLNELYPNINSSEHWHKCILEAMKEDKIHFGMEQREVLCKNKVPREGICIRIEGKPEVKAMKLKTTAFYEREKKAIDSGEVDIEMADAYANN